MQKVINFICQLLAVTRNRRNDTKVFISICLGRTVLLDQARIRTICFQFIRGQAVECFNQFIRFLVEK